MSNKKKKTVKELLVQELKSIVKDKMDMKDRVQNGEDVGKVVKDLDITLAQPL